MSPSFLALLLVAAPAAPELIIVPPQVSGVKPQISNEVWRAISKQIAKEKKTLGVSLSVQNEAKDALAGPARDQAWECAGKPECLADLGATLGAELLITGTVEADNVSLVLIDVKAAKKAVGARSSKKLAAAGWKRQSSAAIRGLIRGFEDWKKAPPPPAADAGEIPDVPQPETGELRIAKSELEGVLEVTVDGATVRPGPEGTISWVGPPGAHTLTALRADGARTSQTVELEPKAQVDVTLAFAAAPPPPVSEPPPELMAARDEDDEDVTGQWWFWTSLGAAAAIGGTTAVLLLGGLKGGPEIGANSGSITGSY